jgi:hypothetical protein
VAPVSEDASQEAVAGAFAVRGRCSAGAGSCAEWLVLGVLMRILLAIIELLLERFGLLLVGKRQCS